MSLKSPIGNPQCPGTKSFGKWQHWWTSCWGVLWRTSFKYINSDTLAGWRHITTISTNKKVESKAFQPAIPIYLLKLGNYNNAKIFSVIRSFLLNWRLMFHLYMWSLSCYRSSKKIWVYLLKLQWSKQIRFHSKNQN